MFVISQISNRFFQAIPTEEVKQHLFKILVDTLLETKDVLIGNAVKNSLLEVRRLSFVNKIICVTVRWLILQKLLKGVCSH